MRRDIRGRILAGWALLLVSIAAGCGITERAPDAPAPPLPARPNVALFIVDTLRADALGCYGAELSGTSPELDDLAARGVRFANVYAQCSWTRPSVASMLTGLLPRRLGIYDEEEGILGDGAVTLAEVLREHGYATFGITANPHMNAAFNFHQGFDDYVDSNAVYPFMETGGDGTIYRQSTLANALDLFERVLEFDGRAGNAPKYVQLNLMEVHEWHRHLQALTRPEYGLLFPEPRYGKYYRPVRQVSEDLVAFVESLQARPGWEDGLFVFVSDHGEGLDSHPNVGNSVLHGRLLYESQLHVPFVMYREGWELAGRVVERPVRLLDLMPTVLDAAGVPVPRGTDGISLMPAVREPGAPLPLPEYFVAETWLRDASRAAVYGNGWRYYENYDEHLGTAPRELQVAGQPEDGLRTSVLDSNLSTAEEMAAFLQTYWQRYPVTPPIPHKQAVSDEEIEQLRALGYLD
jgi:arylsulfatase A-like enzyme